MFSRSKRSANPSVTSPRRGRVVVSRLGIACAGLACFGATGCHDGPLYNLKRVNPYFLSEWKQDRAIGVTDYERRQELEILASTIGSKPAERQNYWRGHLEQIMQNDENAEMRRLAVVAAGNMTEAGGLEIIKKGLDDDVIKVRMQACKSLGGRADDDAARLLVATINTDSDLDVRHTAIAAIGRHKGEIATDSLKFVLSDQNPATRKLAIASLKSNTGKNYGDEPGVWIAALEGKEVEEKPSGFSESLRNFF